MKPKTIGSGRDRRGAARLVGTKPASPAKAPRGDRVAGVLRGCLDQRLPRGCWPEAKLPGGGCFLSGGAPPLSN
jgi:hypothetical protein